jgi:hypothetical protein
MRAGEAAGQASHVHSSHQPSRMHKEGPGVAQSGATAGLVRRRHTQRHGWPGPTGVVSDALSSLSFTAVHPRIVPAATHQHHHRFSCVWRLLATRAEAPRLVADAAQVFGKSIFFVSHAWHYKFSALVAMVLQHYANLPDTKGGARFVHAYYWLDIFAVTQVSVCAVFSCRGLSWGRNGPAPVAQARHECIGWRCSG